jgi:hypothetical protein
VRDARVKKYCFHDYRNTALTDWARQGVNVDIAMKASGHTSVQMHKRYLDLQREDVAKALGLLHDGNTDKNERQAESQVADSAKGEGSCPVVPLVFKTRSDFFRYSIKDGKLSLTPRLFSPFDIFPLAHIFHTLRAKL